MTGDSPIRHDQSWPVTALVRITTKIGSGATPRGGADNYLRNRTRFALVRSQNVFDRRFEYEGLAFITEDQAEALKGVVLSSRDILLNITGDGITFGRACMVPDDVLPACVNQHVSIIRVDPSLADAGYVLAFLTHPDVKGYIESFNAGGSRRAITKGHIESFQLPLPPPTEQRAIASILGSLDDKIELNRRMSETLEAMGLALFKSWFVDFDPVLAKSNGREPDLPKHLADLFPARLVDSEIGEVPEGWEASTVGKHLINYDSRRVPVSGSERVKRLGPYPYHGAAGVLDYIDDYLFDGTYLLVGEDGSVVNDMGLGVTQYVWGKLWVNNHAHVLQGRSAVSTEQLYLYFQFQPVAPYVTGAVQPKLSQGRMNTMPFVFAGEKICREFHRLVDPWFAKLRVCAEEARTLTALRDTLLPKLVSGELRVRDAEKFISRAV